MKTTTFETIDEAALASVSGGVMKAPPRLNFQALERGNFGAHVSQGSLLGHPVPRGLFGSTSAMLGAPTEPRGMFY